MLSYLALKLPARRMLRLLALHPGRDFDDYAAAALAGMPVEPAREQLTQLVRMNLLKRRETGRYELHDGRDWLDLERPNLIATALYAADHGRPECTTGLSSMLMYYLGTASFFTGAEVLHLAAIRCARSDRERGRSYNNLGVLYWQLGRFADSCAVYQQALEFARLAGNRTGEASALSNVALGYYRLNDLGSAIDCQQASCRLFDAEGNLSGMSSALAGWGWAELRIGWPGKALELFEQGLIVSRKLGTDTFEEAFALANLAAAQEALGRLDDAWEGYEQALETSRRSSYVNGESDSPNSLGRLHLAAGRVDQALEHHRQALALAVRRGSRPFTVEVRNDYGHALQAAGRATEAVEQHQIALEDAERVGECYEQARAEAALSRISTGGR